MLQSRPRGEQAHGRGGHGLMIPTLWRCGLAGWAPLQTKHVARILPWWNSDKDISQTRRASKSQIKKK